MVMIYRPRWLLCLCMVKIFWKSSPEPRNRERWNFDIKHWRLDACQICSNDGPWLTSDVFMKRWAWFLFTYILEKYWKVSFRELPYFIYFRIYTILTWRIEYFSIKSIGWLSPLFHRVVWWIYHFQNASSLNPLGI